MNLAFLFLNIKGRIRDLEFRTLGLSRPFVRLVRDIELPVSLAFLVR